MFVGMIYDGCCRLMLFSCRCFSRATFFFLLSFQFDAAAAYSLPLRYAAPVIFDSRHAVYASMMMPCLC